MEMVHKPNYSVAMQMAKKFVSKWDVRPVLQTVCHKPNGDLVVTDAEHLLLVKDVHGFKEEYLVNPKTFEFSTGEYPNIDKIIPPRKEDTIILSADEIKIWHQAHKSMKQMADVLDVDNYHVKMLFHEKTIAVKLHGDYDVSMNLPTDIYVPSDLEMISYNAAYMADALETMVKFKAQEVRIQFDGQHKPFMLHNGEENVMVMILPIRSYGGM